MGALEVDTIEIADDDALIDFWAEHLLEVRIAQSNADVALDEIRKQRRAALPPVQLGIEAERTVQRALPSRFDQGIAAWKASEILAGTPPSIPTQRTRGLTEAQRIDLLLGPTLQVGVPLWDRNQAGIARARVLAVQKWKEYENALAIMAERIRRRSADARAAQDVADLVRGEAIPLEEANLEGAKRAYELGQEGIISVIDAQRSFAALRLTYIAALRDYAVAMVGLEEAVGGAFDPKLVTHGETDAP